MADLNFARGHRDPNTVPPWMYEEVALELGGYMAAAYLAGVEVGRADERAKTVEQFTAALLTGLDDLERDDQYGTLVRPGDVADLVHRVAAEVGR